MARSTIATKTVAGLLLCAGVAVAASLDFGLLMSSSEDPSRMRIENPLEYPTNMTSFVAGTSQGCTEWTAIQWVKITSSNATQRLTGFQVGAVRSMFSVVPGLSTAEGGHPVYTNLLHGVSDDETPLPLVDGAWAGTILPPASSYNSGGMWTNEAGRATACSQFKYGCYVVNIKTDTPLTLTVGGTEKSVRASIDEQRFNVSASSEDRAVSVVASSSSARVYLEIGENPAIEFLGTQMDNTNNGMVNTDPLAGFAGIDGEWKMIVARAKVLQDGSITNRVDAFACDTDYWETPGGGINARRQMPILGGVESFAENARVSMMVFSLGGMQGKTLHRYGTRYYEKWISDSALSNIRDLDVKAMQRKGIVFERMAGDYWFLTNTVESVKITSETTATGVEPNSQVSYDIVAVSNVTTFTAKYYLVNGSASTNLIGIGDVTLSCDDPAATVSGDTITFSAPGSYKVAAVDRIGNVRTNTTYISGPTPYISYATKYKTDTPGTWQEKANNAVLRYVTNSTYVGTYDYTPWSTPTNYFKWRARRLECTPISTGWFGVGSMAFHPLSPHVLVTATHYGFYHGTTLTFVSADNVETGVVSVVANSTPTEGWLTLTDWALTNGFTQADVDAAYIRDIVICQIRSGSVPSSCCPWFIAPQTATNHFGTASVLGWSATQVDLGWGIPVAFIPFDPRWRYAFSSWSTAGVADSWTDSKSVTSYSGTIEFSLSGAVRPDILPHVRGRNYPVIYGGDSGLPLFIDLDGRLVLISHFTGVSNGPSYVLGYRIIKAFVESRGDTLKVIE